MTSIALASRAFDGGHFFFFSLPPYYFPLLLKNLAVYSTYLARQKLAGNIVRGQIILFLFLFFPLQFPLLLHPHPLELLSLPDSHTGLLSLLHCFSISFFLLLLLHYCGTLFCVWEMMYCERHSIATRMYEPISGFFVRPFS